MEHHIKYKGRELCDAVFDGRKLYEIRKNDRDYKVGDIIVPVPLDDNLEPIDHPIKDCKYVITFVTNKWHDVLKEGYCVFGVRRVL